MSRASDKGKDVAEGKVDSVGSLASDDGDHDNDNAADDGREETPDLYRNSSLGMYVLRLGFCSTFVDIWICFQVRRSRYRLNIYASILLNFWGLGDGRCPLHARG
jgi:hypothetical protein